MTIPKCLVYAVLSCTISSTALVSPTRAQITPAECAAIRAKAAEVSTRWFGFDSTGNLSALKAGEDISQKMIDKIVYLHARSDGKTEGTVIAVKITFTTMGNDRDKNWIRVKNSFKNGFSVKYEDYQAFHNGTREIFRIKNNFHLSSGLFFGQIPFTTYTPDVRRSQLRYAEVAGNDERTFRSYLLAIDAVNADGSCVDFKPVIPDATSELLVEIIDLLEDNQAVDFYHGSIRIGLKK